MQVIAKQPTKAQQVSRAESEAIISAARARLNRLAKQKKPVYISCEVDGEEVKIKRLSQQDLIDMALSLARDGHNVLQITDNNGARAVQIAVMVNCVYDKDEQKYFSVDDAEECMDSSDCTVFVSQLFAQCVSVNPDILTTLKKT